MKLRSFALAALATVAVAAPAMAQDTIRVRPNAGPTTFGPVPPTVVIERDRPHVDRQYVGYREQRHQACPAQREMRTLRRRQEAREQREVSRLVAKQQHRENQENRRLERSLRRNPMPAYELQRRRAELNARLRLTEQQERVGLQRRTERLDRKEMARLVRKCDRTYGFDDDRLIIQDDYVQVGDRYFYY